MWTALTLAACRGGGLFPGTTDPVDTPDDTTDVGPPPLPGWLAGVNLSGADFNHYVIPGSFGVDYTYPTTAELDYFRAQGMTVIRMPFLWERLQPTPQSALDAAELTRLATFVDQAKDRRFTVVLDVHNYARYWGGVVLQQRPIEEFTDLWRRLAEYFGGDPDVIFGIMNEPHDMPTETWLTAANAAIGAIRSTGADNLLFVPGNAWTGAYSWHEGWYGTPNASVMTGIVDPLDNYAIEVHQYLDGDATGRSPDCVHPGIGSERIAQFTQWARDNGLRAFLGETGGGPNPTCDQAVHGMLSDLEANADVWLGWSWWAAGPWWGDYMFSIEPRTDGADAPQMAVLRDHL